MKIKMEIKNYTSHNGFEFLDTENIEVSKVEGYTLIWIGDYALDPKEVIKACTYLIEEEL